MKKIIITVLVVIIAGFVYWQNLTAAPNGNGSGLEQVFVVSKGDSASQIGEKLGQAGFIKSPLAFKYYVWKNKLSLKAGEYILSPKLNIEEIISILAGGQSVNNEKTVKIIEGWNMREIDEYLKKNSLLSDGEFLSLAKSPVSSWKFDFDKPEFLSKVSQQSDLEGYLFPDTYRIFKDADSGDLIQKMLDNFDQKLTKEMRADIKKQGKSIEEIITMASLIEKEVRTENDMKIVSGIFWDRIKNRQALQSCATLAYILGVNKTQYTYEDTKINSPYNTYQNPGLPPGPISNPGLNAIKAAIYPTYTDFNYFLSRPDTGETVFSKTLDEHNFNKAKYLK